MGVFNLANYSELEIKLLDVDVEAVKNKLKLVGAKYKGEVLQKIYTYDCYSPILMYKLALNEYKLTKSRYSLEKIRNIYSYIEPVIYKNEQEYLKKIAGYPSICDYIKNGNGDIAVLENKKVLEIIEDSYNRFFKWIRLRENGNKIEFTVKYIYSAEAEYEIEKVREYEINVDNLETANKIIEEMGYIKKKYVEKKRTSYELNGIKIEIDEWPLIKPYIEIEGDTSEKIYDVLCKLGYKKEDAKVMNTEDVYLMYGIDLNLHSELKF